MLLRSSSTPVLGSLLSSFSEMSPNHHNSEPHTTIKHTPTTSTLYPHNRPPLPLNFCKSSPFFPSVFEFSCGSGFRRSNSEGNLQDLAAGSCTPTNNHEGFAIQAPKPPPKCCNSRSRLETIPSSSFYNKRNHYEDQESDEEADKEFDYEGEENGGFNDETKIMNSYDNKSLGFEFQMMKERVPEMYLARGLGAENLNVGFGTTIGGGDLYGTGNCGGGGDFVPVAFGRDGGDSEVPGTEEHYKRLVEENPGNPLFLRNYAQFLYESKRELAKSEELYSRAILADPGDGEVLSQYAKLVWELHRDRDRALSYFQRAVQAAPQDSHVQAAYAGFLWETEEEEEEDNSAYDYSIFPSHFHKGFMASAST